MSETTASAHHSNGHIGIGLLLVLLGIAFSFLFVAATLLQIQTSEAFMSGAAAPTTFQPDWQVLGQLLSMFNGQMTITSVMSIMWGWGVELLAIIAFVGYEVCHDVIRFTNKKIAKVFTFLLVAVFVTDFVTDFNYGPKAGVVSQAAFALITAIIVAFGGTIAVSLVVGGFRHILPER